MVSSIRTPPPREPEPAWDVARLFPDQGHWTEGDYLFLTNLTNGLVELTDGYVEVLEMPKTPHQFIVAYLYGVFLSFVSTRKLGKILFAPLNVRLRTGVFRQPDLAYMAHENAKRIGIEYWDGADLVLEVVSEDVKSRKRDLIEKKQEYADARIREYWVIDPQDEVVTVFKLRGSKYVKHGTWARGETARSALLAGLEVDVENVLNAARGNQ